MIVRSELKTGCVVVISEEILLIIHGGKYDGTILERYTQASVARMLLLFLEP